MNSEFTETDLDIGDAMLRWCVQAFRHARGWCAPRTVVMTQGPLELWCRECERPVGLFTRRNPVSPGACDTLQLLCPFCGQHIYLSIQT